MPVRSRAPEVAVSESRTKAPTTDRVEGWMVDDPAESRSRASFYDHAALRPRVEQWQVWRFVNASSTDEMTRPFVVTVTDMHDGAMAP